MDADQNHFTSVNVAVEAASPDQPVSRELARGILFSKQVVIVPGPPLELLRTSSTLIAVITCAPANGNPSEVIPVASTTRMRLRDADMDSSCVVLRLARPAQCMHTGPRHSVPELAGALRSHHGNLWEVMSSLGRMSLADPQEGVLTAGMSEGDGLWDFVANSPEDFAIGICNICHCCRRRES
jgi:hypothetical protein